MQVLLNVDSHVEGGHPMAAHLEQVVQAALHRFGEHVTRVEAHLTDTNGHTKSHPEEILCTLEARLAAHNPVVVKNHAGNAHQAIQGAVEKLQRAISTALAKQTPRRGTSLPLDDDPDAADQNKD